MSLNKSKATVILALSTGSYQETGKMIYHVTTVYSTRMGLWLGDKVTHLQKIILLFLRLFTNNNRVIRIPGIQFSVKPLKFLHV